MSLAFLWHEAAAHSPGVLRFLGWQSFYTIVVFAAVALLCRWQKRHPALCYGLWGLVFLRLFLPPNLTHPLSAGALAARLWNDTIETETLVLATPASPRIADLLAVPKPAEPSRASEIAAVGVVAAWLFGVLIVLARTAKRRGRFRRIIRQARPVADTAVLELADAWRARFRIRRPVRFLSSAAKSGPFTMGWRRPVIFLPQAVLEDTELVVAMLAHELAHVARCDDLVLKLQHFAQAVYFFHPAVHYAAAAFDGERERLCDAQVLSHDTVATKDYATALLKQLCLDKQLCRDRGAPAAPAMSTTRRRWKMRVRTILARDPQNPKSSLPIWLAVAIFGCVLLPLAGASGSAQPAAAAAETASSNESQSLIVRYSSVLGHTGTVRSLGDWSDDDSKDRGVELARLISSGRLDSMHRGDTILPPEGGSFSASTTAQEFAVTYDVRIEPMPEQVRAWVEIRRDGELVSAPSVTMLYGIAGTVLTGFEGERLLQLLLRIDRPSD